MVVILPPDYEEEFGVSTVDGGFSCRVDSKQFCGDKVVFWRACRSQLLRLADEIRIGTSPLHITSTMTGHQWTINSIDELRNWTLETGRTPVFDQPRTDPHLLSADTGFQVRLQSHLDPTDEYSLHTNPLMAAIAELRSGADHITVRNLVTDEVAELASAGAIVQWATDHHHQLGQALQRHVDDPRTSS